MSVENPTPQTFSVLRLRVTAEADLGALSRVLERFQNLNIVPRRVVAEMGTGETLHIQVDIVGMAEERLTRITAKLNELFVLAVSRSAIVVGNGPVNLGEFPEPQPDLMLLKRREDFYRDKIPEAPDVLLLIEVSDSSLAFDQGIKLNLYARYGVAEYWVVDVEGSRVVIYEEPGVKGYSRKREFAGAETVAPRAFADLEITVAKIFG